MAECDGHGVVGVCRCKPGKICGCTFSYCPGCRRCSACKRCEGDGVVAYLDAWGEGDADFCPRCHGSGIEPTKDKRNG